MKHEVTMYEKLKNDIEHLTLEEVFERIQSGHYGYLTNPLRRLLKEGNLKGYSFAKLSLPAITPCALFDGRRILPNMVRYNNMIVLDIDHLEEEALIEAKRIICLCDFTYACFISPSGRGLKVFVCVSTGPEEHKNAFIAVQQFYMALTGIDIDPSGKDITRLCFVSYDRELYYNPGATVFVPLKGSVQTWPPTEPDKPVLSGENTNQDTNESNVGAALVAAHGNDDKNINVISNVVSTPLNDQGTTSLNDQGTTPLNDQGRNSLNEQGRNSLNDQGTTPLNDQGFDDSNDIPTWALHQPVSGKTQKSEYETIQRCKDYVERHCSFVEGQRHTYVFALAIQFRCRGFDENFTLSELLRDYNFDEREVRNCVKYAYSYVWVNDPLIENVNENKISTTHGRPQGRPLHFQQSSEAITNLQSPESNNCNAIGNEENVGAALVAAHGNTIGNVGTSLVAANDNTIENENNPPPPLPAEKPPSKKYSLRKTRDLFSQWYETHFNKVTGVIEWRHAHTREPFQRLEDHQENSMLCRLHNAGQPIPIQMFHILINSDFSPVYNPFISYRDGLKEPDGTTDYIKQLSDTVKTDNDLHFAFCFKKWFVGYAVALVEDDIVNQTVIVLVGKQGGGKTTWMKRLVPLALSNYLGTAALQTDSKDTAIQLSECCLIILDEMENLNRKDISSFKEMITRPRMRIRRAYGRNYDTLMHRASFIAAVNSKQILTDPTGSRRFLCHDVKEIDYFHKVDIDAAFAQAYALFKEGFQYWFDQDEIEELTKHNDDFMSKSVEEELIEIWLRPVTRVEWKNRHKYANALNYHLMNATQVAIKLMEKAKILLGDNTIVKIGKVLHKLNFEQVRKGNISLYLVRVVDSEVVDKESHVLDDNPATPTEHHEDQQIIMFEEDLTNSFPKDDLPF